MPLSLAFLFALTALLYASVGFGGGSTYNALLVISGVDYRFIPIVALSCNIIVVSGNYICYRRAGVLDVRQILPFVVLSVPMAWLGGRLPVSEQLFTGLLAIALFMSGARLLWLAVSTDYHVQGERFLHPLLKSLIGGGIGFYAGIVGIGGGIFLAPVLHFIRWHRAKYISASCSFFILVNSLAGLAGQFTKLTDATSLYLVYPYWPLIIAVAGGGFIGNYLGVRVFPERYIKGLTSVLILYVAIRLGMRFLS